VGTDAVEGEAKNTMTYIMIDEVVRREVGKLLRVDYRGKFLCSSCLVKFVRDTLGTGYTTSEIDQAMDKVFDSPGALRRIPAFICAECMKTMPGLGSTLRA
jgi:hypothetical protein